MFIKELTELNNLYKRYREYVTEEWKKGHTTKLELLGLIIENQYNAENGVRYRKLTEEEFFERIKTNPIFAGDWGENSRIFFKESSE